jgi:hypothetical protein
MTIDRLRQGITNRTMKFINERRGWKTDRKIVVIESDDWGSIRMPSREVYEKSLKKGYRVDLNPFEKYDSLESEEDLMFLFETLSKFKDINGFHPQITANSLVANPDFDKIKDSNNTEYHFETVDKTFASYPKHSNSLNLWYEGEEKRVFHLQYHGREHINNAMFMNALKNKKEEAFWILENRMGGSITKNGDNKNNYVAASNFSSRKELSEGINNIKEGLQIYKKLHKKESESYIATNNIWPEEFEEILSKEGVKYLQGGYAQKMPKLGMSKQKTIFHYLGEKNDYNQIYLVRNVIFEPTITRRTDDFEICLKQIDRAFKLSKPAIISSHRVNYIGSIFEENRITNLKLLDELLKKILKLWPNVEFMNSVQLGELIKEDVE